MWSVTTTALYTYRSIDGVRGALGRGLCLVDFSAAVDLSGFPDDTTFVGSGRLQCPQMKEGRPWKWQVRVPVGVNQDIPETRDVG